MNIIVLDGYTLNPGDLDWQPLANIAKQDGEGQFHCYDRTSEAELIGRASNADIIFTNKTPITAEVLSQLPSLKYIGVLATGTNVVDLNCARERGVAVTNVPGYGPDAVAQMVFAHILHHTQRVSIHHRAVSEGKWTDCEDFCFTLAPLQSLQGKTLGLMGYGAIGRQVANIALAFGMKVLVNTRTEPLDLPPGVKWAAFDSMIPQVDILSLHCPLTEATDKMINRTVLEKMRSSAILINTARGGLIDEAALKQALDEGEIAAAGVDVLSTEPPQADNPLLNAVNISISPHNSWATREARQNLLNIAIGNLQAFLSEKPRNRVN
ncbi:D-2-hydroxyacid dehydrogenase [Shewanella canadensis]|uniref:D-2-hydroxyacid dehydrogenase n=1 Tax=Shewanella canadensis TaxID=271096 RepID=A0A431X093_9GAMM|nr:D-2-hydroxyacid dehydrogenase [Shewanella canadensis]RTR40873.1 D-2-hydroxyacid dehydrogenase [Shewanella canadensis]